MTREESLQKYREVNTKENIIRIFQQNQIVINDHSSEREERPITGLVEFKDSDDRGLAGCFDASYYSLNSIYINPTTSELHVSRRSIAGVLKGAYPDAEQLKKYNSESDIQIVCIHLVDGTKVYPAE